VRRPGEIKVRYAEAMNYSANAVPLDTQLYSLRIGEAILGEKSEFLIRSPD